MVGTMVTTELLLLFVTLTSGRRLDPPEISIGGWMENGFGNHQWIFNGSVPLGPSPFRDSLAVASTVRGLSLVCNASYPIEWSFHRERWGGRSRLQYAIRSTRISEGLDIKGFSLEISFFSFESNSVTGNYTCQKVGNPEISTSKYIFWEGSSPPFLTLSKMYRKPPVILYRNESGNSFILPCTVSVPDVSVNLSKEGVNHTEIPIANGKGISFDPRIGFTITNHPNPYGRWTCQIGDEDEDVLTFLVQQGDDGPTPEFNDTLRQPASVEIDTESKEIVCCSNNDKPPKLKLVECDHPTICLLAKHTLHKMESGSTKIKSCARAKMHFLRSGVFRCVGPGVDVVREYFFPIPEAPNMNFMGGSQGKPKSGNGTSVVKNTTDGPRPYFSWQEADPLKMMLVTKLNRPAYVGENRTFSCRVSHFYYAQGIVWSVEYKNETIHYIGGRAADLNIFIPHMGKNRHFEFLIGNNQAYIDLMITADLASLVCHAPVWNSTEWGKKAINLNIKVPTAPALIGDSFKEVTWTLNTTNQVLECDFTGDPMPQVVWKRGNHTFALNTLTKNGSSTVTFPRVGLTDPNDYQCILTNSAGSVTKRFKVNVVPPSSSITGILVACLVGLLVLGVAVGLMWKYMRSQKNVIDYLASRVFKEVSSTPADSQRPTAPPNRELVSVDGSRTVLQTSSFNGSFGDPGQNNGFSGLPSTYQKF